MARLNRSEVRRRLEAGAGRGLGALLEADERLVNRQAPPTPGALDPSTPSWSGRPRDGWSEIRVELDRLVADGVRLPETDHLVGADQGAEGRWTTYMLCWYGAWLKTNARRCPATSALLRRVPDLQVAGFTVLDGHTHLPAHRGPAKSYRWQMASATARAPFSFVWTLSERIGPDRWSRASEMSMTPLGSRRRTRADSAVMVS